MGAGPSKAMAPVRRAFSSSMVAGSHHGPPSAVRPQQTQTTPTTTNDHNSRIHWYSAYPISCTQSPTLANTQIGVRGEHVPRTDPPEPGPSGGIVVDDAVEPRDERDHVAERETTLPVDRALLHLPTEQERMLRAFEAAKRGNLRLVTRSVGTLRGPLPFAHATPLRAAITAAATSLWAMHDDADTRIRRAVVLNYHDAENFTKYLDGRPADKAPDAAAAAAAQRLVADHWAKEASKLGEDVTRKGWKPTADFEMIKQATQGMPDWGDGWRPATEVPSQWRMLSCFAHGMRWATAPHVTQGEADAHGFAATTFEFDLDMLMESAGIVRTLIERALDRYREMADHPQEKNRELESIVQESMTLA